MDQAPNDPSSPATGPVGPPSVGRPAPPPPPPDSDSGRTIAIAAGATLVVFLAVVGAALLGLGPFSRTTPSPSPFSGIVSPSPSITTRPTLTVLPTDVPSSSATARPSTPAPTTPSTPSPTAPPTPSPTAPPPPSPDPTATPSPSPSPTASSTLPATQAPTPTIDPTPSPASPSPTPLPTDAPGNVSGELDPQIEAFLVRLQLAEEDISVDLLERLGPLQSGTDLVDYASFELHGGRGVVWQAWMGPETVSIEHLSDVRMAFPTTEDAVGFMGSFGDELARVHALTEYETTLIGEESRALAARHPDTPSGPTTGVVHLWRRGDLVALTTFVIRSDDLDFARGVAHDLAARAGEKLDRALGIEPA